MDKDERYVQEIQDSVKVIEEGFDNLEVDVDESQSVVENTDNLAKKNNVKLFGLK